MEGIKLQATGAKLDELPAEILLLVISHLELADLKSAQHISRRLRAVVAYILWGNVELNLVSNKKSSMAREDRWTKDVRRAKGREIGREPWMILNSSNLHHFFEAYESGLLRSVLPAIKCLNIVENTIETSAKKQSGSDRAVVNYRIHLNKLSETDLPRLRLLRVSCAVSGSMGLHFLRNFASVEKYIWAQYSKPVYAKQYMLAAFLSATTSLTIQTSDMDKSILNTFSPLLQNLESLQITSRDRHECVVDASIMRDLMARSTPQMRRLVLTRVEVSNPSGINWLPSHIHRLILNAREEGRVHLEPHAGRREEELLQAHQRIISFPHVSSLYVNLLHGKDTLNLRNMEFTNLESLYFKSVQRDLDPDLCYDVRLFRANEHLKRVVYNCSSPEGMAALAEHAASLEVLSFQRPVTRSFEVLPYDIDATREIAIHARQLKFLSLTVSSRHITNAVKVLREFITRCQTLDNIYLVSVGNFTCRGVVHMQTFSVDDGYSVQYLKATRRGRLYRVDIPAFRDAHCLDRAQDVAR